MSAKRFVLLHHQMPLDAERASHWDLMLEHDGKLLTWELPTLEMKSLPIVFQALGIRRIADHRLHYLDYEGPVSGGRGNVSREDFGDFCVESGDSDGLVKAKLTGSRLDIELELPAAYFSISACHSEIPGVQVPDAAHNRSWTEGRVLHFIWK